MQADAAGKGMGVFARDDRAARLVKGDQRRRTRGVDGHARAAQVEDVRNAVGGNARRVAGSGRRVDHRQVVGQAIRIVGAGDPDVDAAATAAQGRRPDAGVFECFPAHFEQQALLRVHQSRFAAAGPSKPLRAARYQRSRRRRWRHRRSIRRRRCSWCRGGCVAGAGVVSPRMEESLLRPALWIDRGHQISTVQQVLPVPAGAGSGHSEGIADDGDAPCHAGWYLRWFRGVGGERVEWLPVSRQRSPGHTGEALAVGWLARGKDLRHGRLAGKGARSPGGAAFAVRSDGNHRAGSPSGGSRSPAGREQKARTRCSRPQCRCAATDRDES